MSLLDKLQQNCHLIEERIGYRFQNKELLETALIHRSYANEHKGEEIKHNERLEFLGDTVLGLIVSDYLYREFPDQPEGELSYLRSRIVEAATCSQFVQKLGIDEFILVGKGESMNVGKGRNTILSDLFEALLGAIYLDGGLDVAITFYLKHFSSELTQIIAEPMRNWKAELQDFAQRETQMPPVYEVEKEEGPDHAKTFHVIVKVGDRIVGQGTGSSKKEAEQSAAEEAMRRI